MRRNCDGLLEIKTLSGAIEFLRKKQAESHKLSDEGKKVEALRTEFIGIDAVLGYFWDALSEVEHVEYVYRSCQAKALALEKDGKRLESLKEERKGCQAIIDWILKYLKSKERSTNSETSE